MLRDAADGVIVGSAIVRKMEAKRPIDAIVKDVGDLVQELSAALG
jgi:tryptophan synthase alpha subunit